ncbi:MAG TPA: VanZ family protein, partial [Pseudacidobacterium sp.]|nr:VanZ family protein [Pseudacidobacterium sp.]
VAVILVESTGTMSASNTSRWLLPIWIKLFGPITPERWQVIHFWIRKTGHFVGYGFVSLGFFNGWRATFSGKSSGKGWLFALAAPLALVSTLALASWDEWHQSFLPGRTSSTFDVGIDLSGAIVAHLVLALILLIVWRIRAVRSKRSKLPQVSVQE